MAITNWTEHWKEKEEIKNWMTCGERERENRKKHLEIEEPGTENGWLELLIWGYCTINPIRVPFVYDYLPVFQKSIAKEYVLKSHLTISSKGKTGNTVPPDGN